MLIAPKQYSAARAKRISSLYGVTKWKQFKPLAPNQWTSWTLRAWYRTPESIQAGGTMTGTGTSVPNVTLSTADNFIHPFGLYVDITTAGVVGVSRFDCGIDNPVRAPGARLLINQLTAATVAVPTTPYTLNFAAGTYSLDADYQIICPAWLDKVGAYPASVNNFITGSGAATSSRPIICNPGNFGVPCIRFDGVNDYLECTGALAATFGGADAPNCIVALVDVLGVPAASPGYVYGVTNITDADIPFQRMGMTTTGAWNASRRSDTGVDKIGQSNFDAFSGPALLIDSFDGTNRHLSWHSADVIGKAAGLDPIGGDSLVSSNQSGSTITPTRVTLGGISSQAGRTNFLSMDLYEIAFGTGEPNLQDRIGGFAYWLS